ncbi:hypothetical protein D3C71_1753970 [compost metagenome]
MAYKTLPYLLQVCTPLKDQHDAVQLRFQPGFLFILLIKFLLPRPLQGQIPEQPVEKADNLTDFILSAVLCKFYWYQ